MPLLSVLLVNVGQLLAPNVAVGVGGGGRGPVSTGAAKITGQLGTGFLNLSVTFTAREVLTECLHRGLAFSWSGLDIDGRADRVGELEIDAGYS